VIKGAVREIKKVEGEKQKKGTAMKGDYPGTNREVSIASEEKTRHI